jgi:alpha-1,4-digalacturonate transport system substrate-binding protein
MMQRTAFLSGACAIALTLGATASAFAVELRYMCTGDGNECVISRQILDGFEKANPDIKVAVDTVPYKAILESLPVQLAAGEGPDLARITDLGGLSRYALDISPYVDRAYWEENFGPSLAWFRTTPGDEGIYGMMTQLTITGPYINKTLFEQAGVEPPPEGASWADWAEAARAVAQATETPFPMAIDRSGHRLAGPAISNGAKFFDAEGKPKLVDEGFSATVRQFVEWNQDGTMAKEVWAGRGGSGYQDALQEFVNGQLVYYFSGSWQVQRLGGSGLVGFKHTQHPEEVAKVIDFFASPEIHEELIARTLNVPAHKGLIAKGMDYPDAPPQAAAALKAWGEHVEGISPVAYQLQGYPDNRTLFNVTVQRVTQAIVGELTVDEALERIEADLAAAK